MKIKDLQGFNPDADITVVINGAEYPITDYGWAAGDSGPNDNTTSKANTTTISLFIKEEKETENKTDKTPDYDYTNVKEIPNDILKEKMQEALSKQGKMMRYIDNELTDFFNSISSLPVKIKLYSTNNSVLSYEIIDDYNHGISVIAWEDHIQITPINLIYSHDARSVDIYRNSIGMLYAKCMFDLATKNKVVDKTFYLAHQHENINRICKIYRDEHQQRMINEIFSDL